MSEHTRNQKRMYRIHKQEEKILEQELMIASLQQKVEQLEKELQITANKCKQLENIRKEAIEYVKSKEFAENFPYVMNECQVRSFLLNILNKGSESNV